ncbi:hypothetical protein Poli38472_011105 [Pythium oligandrum]|uniref:Uncharacterized protein n=1 Tax=Pythium oligandrum TaxID=41045 RepID=A0A8K1FKT8_PYTOL|nr:hypothetical protein Poli38472_011105 [Pythium oligandrum]|eukprot:TMW67485.1 hypothetical protein Poli38472_011105 [Pythium oligandrum]
MGHDDTRATKQPHEMDATSTSLGGMASKEGLAITVDVSAPSGHGGAPTMTPTTIQAANARMPHVPATLTPMGDDKVSATPIVAQQRSKETKRKAATQMSGGEPAKAPKKASPRVRSGNGKTATKAEKRKSSPARATTSDTTTATAAPMTGAGATQSSTPTVGTPSFVQTTQEVHPSQDNELRKVYLQRLYHHLQATHRNHDDALIRRLATTIEMGVCRRVQSRNEYVTQLNQEMQRLMQHGLGNSSGSVTATPQHSTPTNHVPAQEHDYGTTNAPTQVASSTSVAQATQPPTDGSFMSLLSSDQKKNKPQLIRPQAQVQQGTAYRFMEQRQPTFVPGTSPMASYAAQERSANERAPVDTSTGRNQQYGQPFSGPRTMHQQVPASGFVEFATQLQHVEKNALIEMMWNQRYSMMQMQRRVAQLEMMLSSRTTSPAQGAGPSSSSPGSMFANPTTAPSYAVGASATTGMEGDAQHMNDSRSARGLQHQQGYPYAPSPSSFAQAGNSLQGSSPSTPSTPAPQGGGPNPSLYWEKVRTLKEAYLRPLYFALQALSQHTAPPNSQQSIKAENVKHNITLAISILAEQPTNVQPRPLDLLESIERFILSTVVPIVRKVQPQGFVQSMNGGGYPTQYAGPVLAESARPSVSIPPFAPSSTPQTTSAAMNYAGSVTSAPVSDSNASGKSGQATGSTKPGSAKSGARKSPKNASKRTTTPRNSSQKNGTDKSTGKKSPSRSSRSNQSAGVPPSVDSTQQQPNSVGELGSSPNDTKALEDSSVVNEGQSQGDRLGTTPNEDNDDMNDFPDFPELDFSEELQESFSKEQNEKENSTCSPPKRPIDDL